MGAKQPLAIEQVEIDKPNGARCWCAPSRPGVCHSDLHLWRDSLRLPAPAVLGHESAGIVEAVGDRVSYVKPGDHVIACLSVFCGHCDQCLSGHPNRCANRAELQRGEDRAAAPFAERQAADTSSPISRDTRKKMLLHENAVVKITEEMPLDGRR